MNEQLIFELAVKHKHIVGELPLNTVEQLKLVELGRFAEEVVRECVSLCEDLKFQHRSYRMEETDFSMKNIYAEGEATCDLLQHKMKKHFGVEE